MDFHDLLSQSLSKQSFIQLTLSNVLNKQDNPPRKQTVQPVSIRNELHYQWELQHERQQNHLNLTAEETVLRADELLGTSYKEAYLYTSEADFTLRVNGERRKIRRHPASKKQDASQLVQHDRQKDYLIPEGVPCPFLESLGVMTATGHVKSSRHKKFRQINRYLEMINDIYPSLPTEGPLHVVDFGCGLSYLTFAVHHLLHVIHQRDVVLVGIDQQEHVIQRCQQLAEKLGIRGMEFRTGQIESFQSATPVHLAISLHACNTATDHALSFGVNVGAQVILAVPCCQHEVFEKMKPVDMTGLFKDGIIKERVAALATDTLRSMALQSRGYRTQILEFIDLEHTPKNLLIRAVLRKSSSSGDQARNAYHELKQSLGLESITTDLL